MIDQVYADDVGSIIVSGAIVRFDLMTFSPTENEPGGKPKLVMQQRVVMPIDVFVRATTRMQTSVQDMVKKGVIKHAPKPSKDEPKK